jgi:hypothetical protein
MRVARDGTEGRRESRRRVLERAGHKAWITREARGGCGRRVGLAVVVATALVVPSLAISAPVRFRVHRGSDGVVARHGQRHTERAPAASKPKTYVGSVSGSRALVGIVVLDSRARAYVCDGKRIASWFNGYVNKGSMVLFAARPSRLTTKLDGRTATGTVTLANGRHLRFRATRATGRAGLYRGSAHGYVAGWILLGNGRQRGAIKDISTGTLTTAPRLTSTALLDGRISITPIPIPELGAFTMTFTSAGGLGH